MKRIWSSLAIVLLAASASQAATTNTTLTVTNATGAIGATGITVNGPATLSGIDTNAKFSATASLTGLSGTNATAPFTITLSAGGTITGNLTIPVTLLLGSATSGTGSATVTGGTGTYAAATGSFPALTGSGSLSGATVTLSFFGNGTITTGGSTGGGPTPPSITAVEDAASYGSSLAQGGIFIITGSNLCPSGYTAFSVPRPTLSPDGVKITFTPTAGGTGTDALLWYEYNQNGTVQLAGILPSTVATGNYNVTVTNGAASAPFPTKVVQSNLRLFTQDSSGSGLASVQNFISQTQVDLNSFTTGNGKGTTISPAHPGQFLLAYGTGMGPLVGGDNTAAPAYDFSTHGVTVTAIVGGMSVPVSYAGRAGYAGEDQINLALPANVPTGCAVSFQISVNGTLSNATFIAIAPDTTSSACVAPGFTTSQLQKLDGGGTFTSGGFDLLNITETLPQLGTQTIALASGAFTQYTGFQLSAAAASSPYNTGGGCQVIPPSTSSSQTTVVTTIGGRTLDAGAVTLTGPAGSNITNLALTETSNTYSATISTIAGLPGGNGGTIVAGTYTLNGAGGKDVGKFNASVTIGTPLAITGGLPTVVNRSQGLTLNWTGGNSTDLVEIFGSSAPSTATGTTSFICISTAGQQTFTVPASILQQLPASGTGFGALEVFSAANPTIVGNNGSFLAPLTAGGNIDAGFFLALSGVASTPTYQ